MGVPAGAPFNSWGYKRPSLVPTTNESLLGKATVVGVEVGDGVAFGVALLGIAGVGEVPSPLEETWSPHAVRRRATEMKARNMVTGCHGFAGRTSEFERRG